MLEPHPAYNVSRGVRPSTLHPSQFKLTRELHSTDGSTSIAMSARATQRSSYVTRTSYTPEVRTTIDGVLSPFDHVYSIASVAPCSDSTIESPCRNGSDRERVIVSP